jgi:hypothetical protein
MARCFKINTYRRDHLPYVLVLIWRDSAQTEPKAAILSRACADRLVPVLCARHGIYSQTLMGNAVTVEGLPDVVPTAPPLGYVRPLHVEPTVRTRGGGTSVFAYLRHDRPGRASLATWDGATILAARCTVVRSYDTWDGRAEAVAFRLGSCRWIVGLSMGEGMLFRGELAECADLGDASEAARAEAERWLAIDETDRIAEEENWADHARGILESDPAPDA